MDRSYLKQVLNVAILVLGFSIAGCNNDEGDPSGPKPGETVGKVIGTINKGPVAGSTVQFGGGVTTTTNHNGDYVIPENLGGIVSINVTGSSHFPRQVTKDLDRNPVTNIEVIERINEFSLPFYRQLVRDAEESFFLRPTNRWESQPTFFIDTRPEIGTGNPIPSGTIDSVRSIIQQSIPVFTNNFIASPRIMTTNNPPADLTSGSIIIRFDHTLLQRGAFGVTRIQTAGNRIDAAVVSLVLNPNFPFDELTSHELGHAVGFFHASARPSVMVAVGSCTCGLFTSDDSLHMKINYSRPAGNRDIDEDPAGAITKSLAKREVIEVVCRK